MWSPSHSGPASRGSYVSRGPGDLSARACVRDLDLMPPEEPSTFVLDRGDEAAVDELVYAGDADAEDLGCPLLVHQ